MLVEREGWREEEERMRRDENPVQHQNMRKAMMS